MTDRKGHRMHKKLLRLAFLFAFLAPFCGHAENLAKFPGWKLQQPESKPARLVADEKSDTLRIEISKATEPFYLIQVAQPVSQAVADGDLLRLSFRARSPTANPLRAVVERSGPPYESVIETRTTISPEWKDYSVSGESLQAYAAGLLSLRIQCGQQTGVIEIASFRLENLGVSPAGEAARAALDPDATEARIKKYRTGDLRVEVRDANGKPVSGATVKIEMTRSAFLFGCNIFKLDPKNTEPWQIAYQSEFTNIFNYATLPFYWGSFEHEQGKPDYARLEKMAQWCRDHGVEPKGHPLVWHEAWPSWAPKDADAAIPLFHHRVSDLISHYRGLVSFWDVLNEANNAADFTQTGEGNWVKRDGPAAVVSTALGWAREAVGTNRATLLYNDYNSGAENEKLIGELQKMNALPDAIGIQSHMHDHVWPLRRVWQTCERFGAFGRPLHFTELTVISSTNRPKEFEAKRGEWPTTPDGEALQADYCEKLYTLLFSHPAVQAITWWDFSDRDAWRNAPAGLIREDMTPKPAYEKLHTLIRKKWWTRADGTSDSSGTFSTRAFHGDYRITATTPDGRRAEITARLSPGSDGNVEIKL